MAVGDDEDDEPSEATASGYGAAADGNMSPSQFTSSTLKSLAARAKQPQASGGQSGGASGSGGASQAAAPPEDFRSAALRGLAEQTKSTVDNQSKFSRGEGVGTQPKQQGGGRAAGSGFPFGDILGALGGEGGGAGGDGSMGFMVDFIMQNLLSKEVLYSPLKVSWLASRERDRAVCQERRNHEI